MRATSGREISAVILDLDDTLVSSYRRPDLAWRAVCEDFRIEFGSVTVSEAATVLEAAGRAVWDVPLRHAMGRADPQKARRIIVEDGFSRLRRAGRPTPSPEAGVRLADAFSRHREERAALEPGALEMLASLKAAGYRLALLTNGQGPLQRAKIERFGLAGYFDHIQIEGETGVGKPDVAAYDLLFKALAVGPETVCVVGDSLAWDIVMPKQWGCLTVLYDPDGIESRRSVNGTADVVVQTLASVAVLLGGKTI